MKKLIVLIIVVLFSHVYQAQAGWFFFWWRSQPQIKVIEEHPGYNEHNKGDFKLEKKVIRQSVGQNNGRTLYVDSVIYQRVKKCNGRPAGPQYPDPNNPSQPDPNDPRNFRHFQTKEQIEESAIRGILNNTKAEFQDLYEKMDELIWYKYGQKQKSPQTYTLKEWATFVNGHMNSSLSLKKHFAKHGEARIFYMAAMYYAIRINNISINDEHWEAYFNYRHKNKNTNDELGFIPSFIIFSTIIFIIWGFAYMAIQKIQHLF